MEEEEVLFW